MAAAAARRSLEWAAVGAARPWVDEGAGCVAGVPQAARSCLYLQRVGSSWLGPGVGWLAVALLDSWLALGGCLVGATSGRLGPGAGWVVAVLLNISWRSASRSLAAAAW